MAVMDLEEKIFQQSGLPGIEASIEAIAAFYAVEAFGKGATADVGPKISELVQTGAAKYDAALAPAFEAAKNQLVKDISRYNQMAEQNEYSLVGRVAGFLARHATITGTATTLLLTIGGLFSGAYLGREDKEYGYLLAGVCALTGFMVGGLAGMLLQHMLHKITGNDVVHIRQAAVDLAEGAKQAFYSALPANYQKSPMPGSDS